MSFSTTGMATLYTEQSKNIRKTWLLVTVFLIVVIGLGYFFSFYFNNPSILYIAVFFSVFMNILSYWYSDKIVLRMTGAKPAEHDDNPELYNIVENLAITAGLPMPKIYIINDPAPNAFATGRDKDHAAVAVTTGIILLLNKTELEGVIAHELSHIGNRDMLVSTVIVVLVGFISILSNIFIRSSMFGLGSRGGKDRGGIMVLIGIVLSILAPIAATLIQLAISRKREFLADASGSLLTRYPEGLASALKKIGAYKRPMLKANTATAHLFIANPFGPSAEEKGGEEKVPFMVRIFSTHPPISERVEALLSR